MTPGHILCFAVFCLVGSGTQAPAEPLLAKDIYTRTLKGTVRVLMPKVSGTGWVIDKAHRLVLTNHHIAGNDFGSATVEFPVFQAGKLVAERSYYNRNRELLRKQGRVVNGRVLDISAAHDLAIIQLDALPADAVELKLAPDSASPGERVHSIGNPSASDALWVYTPGIVRQDYRKVIRFPDNVVFDCRVLETHSPTNPGDSGGPVVNGQGQVVGVVAKHNNKARLVTWCIDVSEVKKLLAEAHELLDLRTARAHGKRGDILFAQKKWTEAAAAYKKALDLEPKNGRLQADLAGVLLMLKRPEEAKKALRKAVVLGDPIAKVWEELGGERGKLGLPTSPEQAAGLSTWDTEGRMRLYESGVIFLHATGKHKGKAFAVSGTLGKKYLAFSNRAAYLGYPTDKEVDATPSPAGTHGRFQWFENGSLIWHGDGKNKDKAFAVYGSISVLYQKMKGTASPLGMPTSDERDDKGSRRTDFENGWITWNRKEGAKAHVNGGK